MVSYNAAAIPPRGLRRRSAHRFPANHHDDPNRGNAPRRATTATGWTHYVNDHFFDRPDLEPNLERLAFRLERLAREKPWCLTSNRELREQLGCSRNTLADLLNRGESLGWFRRVLVPGRDGRATARLGFVLFVRPTDRPVATPETFDQVADQMRAEIDRGRARTRPRTLTFPEPMPRESADPVPKNWAPSPYLKETSKKTTTETTDAGSSSLSSSLHLNPGPEPGGDRVPGVPASGEIPAPRSPAAAALVVAEPPAAAAAPPVAADLPAGLVAAAAEAVPGASREWLAGLLRGCGPHGLDLALLVLAWVKQRRPEKPARYAWTALSGWVNRLGSGELTLADVRTEVHGRAGARGAPRPFDPKTCLARLESHGWTIAPYGEGQVKPAEIPDRGAPVWDHLPRDLRQDLEAHKPEMKAYVLGRASERGKAVALRA